MSVLLTSCAFPPKYYYQSLSGKGMNFKTGKGLVNTPESSISRVKDDEIMTYVVKDLKTLGGDSVMYKDETIGAYFVPSHIPFDLKPEDIELLKNTTSFDYVINILFAKGRDAEDIANLNIYTTTHRNTGLAKIIVYEIKTGLKIYDQQVTAVSIAGESIWFSATHTPETLVYKALKKIIKPLNKYSVKRVN